MMLSMGDREVQARIGVAIQGNVGENEKVEKR
jgi:hypothetical protein